MIAKIDRATDYHVIIQSLYLHECDATDPILKRSYKAVRERLHESHDQILRQSALKHRDPDTGDHDPVDDHIPYPW